MKTVGIFLAGQAGDIMSAASVLHYRKELWGEKHKIVWFMEERNFDLLAHQDIELREFPRGFGYPEMVEEENKKLIEQGKEPVWRDWQPLMDENNHLNLELAKHDSMLVDITKGYFPAPHQMGTKFRHDIEYPNCSKKAFCVPMEWEWHPVLSYTNDDYAYANMFMGNFSDSVKIKNIAIETFAGSGQSLLSDVQVRRTLKICEDVLGKCNFIFVSHKYLNGQESFPAEFMDKKNVHFAREFTVRQCGLIVNKCDLLISVSSGISVASSAWNFKQSPTPILQFCGSNIASTRAMALGRFELVTHDLRNLDVAVAEYETKLISMLNEIK